MCESGARPVWGHTARRPATAIRKHSDASHGVFGVARTGLIAMDGEGSVRVRPDSARIRLGVSNEGGSASEIAQDNATQMSSVMDAVKKVIGDAAGVEIRTEAVTLAPIYAGTNRGRSAVSGYRANNTVHISIRDLDQRGLGFIADKQPRLERTRSPAQSSWSSMTRSRLSRHA